MAFTVTPFQHYSSTGTTHEDLGDLVTRISPEDTPFLSMVTKTRAYSRVHLFATDALGARTAVTPRTEGFAFTSDTLSGITRNTNYVEITAEQVTVSDSLEWMNQVGTASERARQMEKAAKQWAIRCENRLWSTATGVSGATGTAPQIKAILPWITTNTSTSSGNRTLTQAILNAVLTGIYTQGGMQDRIFCGPARKINLIDINSTNYGQRNVSGQMGVVEQRVDMYVNDLGQLRVELSRDIATDTYALIQMSTWALAWGVRPRTIPIAKTGYSTSAMIVGEYTLEARAENANGKIEDISG